MTPHSGSSQDHARHSAFFPASTPPHMHATHSTFGSIESIPELDRSPKCRRVAQSCTPVTSISSTPKPNECGPAASRSCARVDAREATHSDTQPTHVDGTLRTDRFGARPTQRVLRSAHEAHHSTSDATLNIGKTTTCCTHGDNTPTTDQLGARPKERVVRSSASVPLHPASDSSTCDDGNSRGTRSKHSSSRPVATATRSVRADADVEPLLTRSRNSEERERRVVEYWNSSGATSRQREDARARSEHLTLGDDGEGVASRNAPPPLLTDSESSDSDGTTWKRVLTAKCRCTFSSLCFK